jgi:hypothetical protein
MGVLFLAGGLRAGTGTSGETFLQIPMLAGPAGMAGADTALAAGVEGLEYNPAALGGLAQWDLAADHLAYAQGISLDELAAGWGRAGYGGALSVLSLGTPAVPETDANGNQIGTFREQDLAVTGGGGGVWGPWSAGLNGRVVNLSLDNYSERGAEADLGAGYAPWGGLRFGLALQHLGALSGSGLQDSTPLTLRGGAGWSGSIGHGFVLAADSDLVAPNDASVELLEGLQVNWSLVYLRAGGEWSQDWDQRQTFTLGAGFKLDDLILDYAFSNLVGLGITQRIGISWRPGLAQAASPEAAPPAAGPGPSPTRPPSPAPMRSATAAPTGTPTATVPAPLALSATPLAAASAPSPTPTPSPSLEASASPSPTQTASPTPAPSFSPTPVQAGIPAPGNLRIVVSGASRKLVWDLAPGAGAESFQLLVSHSSGTGYVVAAGPLLSNELVIANIKQPLYAVVQALVKSDQGTRLSAYSNEVQVLPLP